MDKEVRDVMKQVKALEGEEKPKIVARTRVSGLDDSEVGIGSPESAWAE
jgi:hypothetical protein